MNARVRVVASLAALLMITAACSDGGTGIALVASETQENPGTAPGGLLNMGFALPGEVVTDQGPTLTVKAGESVTVTLENLQGQYGGPSDSHDFAVVPAGLDLGTMAATRSLADEALWGSHMPKLFAGETGEITFTPTQSGTYQYVCTIPGHPDFGMAGDFVVEQ